MNAIGIEASFYYEDEDAPNRLAQALSHFAPTVENCWGTGVCRVHIQRVEEGDPFQRVRAILNDLETLPQSDFEGPFELAISIEELVAVAGNWHRRGQVVPVTDPRDLLTPSDPA